MEHPKQKTKSGSPWMNFKKIFQDYGCCGGDRDDISVSSTDSQTEENMPKRKRIEKFFMQPKKQQKPAQQGEEKQSIVASTNWTEFDETPRQSAANLTLSQSFSSQIAAPKASAKMDEYVTQEPIDFDSLKELVNHDEDIIENQSIISSISQTTKKIKKEDAKDRQINIHNAKSKIKRTPWQPSEDSQVLELVEKYGARWAKIASMLPGRTGKQVRDRYTNKLKPNIKKDEWTKEEEDLFNSLCQELGHRWSKIASYLPGRTEGQVKNRYYAQFRKKPPKSDEKDQTSKSISDGIQDRSLGIPELQFNHLNREKAEEQANFLHSTSFHQDPSIEAELEKYTQGYLNEEKAHFLEHQHTPRSLQQHFLGFSNTNDPTNVISYRDIPTEIGEPTSHHKNYFNKNMSAILQTPPSSTKGRMMKDWNFDSAQKDPINLQGNKMCLEDYGKYGADLGNGPNLKSCCLGGVEVLNKCENLSKRMTQIEFLLAHILKDLKEIKLQGNKG